MHKLGELGENSRSNVRIFYMYLDVYFWAKMFIAYFDILMRFVEEIEE